MRSSRSRVRRSSEISCVLANPRAARSASACRNGSCSSGAVRAGERPSPRLPSSWSETCSGRLTQCARSMVISHFASSSSWAIARSESVSIEITRGSPARSAATVSSICSARRPPGRQVGGELGPAGALVVRGEPLRLAGLVDDVQRARVGDARHDQRDELVGALAGPAGAVGDPLDLEQELEAVVALADPERGAGDAGCVEREPHLGAPAGRHPRGCRSGSPSRPSSSGRGRGPGSRDAASSRARRRAPAPARSPRPPRR